MSDFFRGWKRLIGVALLLFSSAIMAGSVSSEFCPQTMEGLYSRRGAFELYELNDSYDDDDASSVGDMRRIFLIPYWSIALPMAFVAGWLILSRQPAAAKPTFLRRIELAFDKVLFGWKRKTAFTLLASAPILMLFAWGIGDEAGTILPCPLLMASILAASSWLIRSKQPEYPLDALE